MPVPQLPRRTLEVNTRPNTSPSNRNDSRPNNRCLSPPQVHRRTLEANTADLTSPAKLDQKLVVLKVQ